MPTLSHIVEMRSGAVKKQKYRYCRTSRGRTLEERKSGSNSLLAGNLGGAVKCPRDTPFGAKK